jgi:hypothetical protein
LTFGIKHIETHEDISTWTIHTLNFKNLTHPSPIKPGSMTLAPTPTIEDT